MANKFKVEIQETLEELEHRLERAITAVSKEKLLLLYWIATKKIKTREELARMLKRDESTIYRWLKTYKQHEITELLTVKKAPGKTPHIPPEVREKLRFFLTWYAKSIAKSVKESEKIYQNINQVLVRLDIGASLIVNYQYSLLVFESKLQL